MADLKELLKKAVEAFNAIPADKQREMLEAQRQSWARGEAALDPTPCNTAPVDRDNSPAVGDGLITVAWLGRHDLWPEGMMSAYEFEPQSYKMKHELVTRENAEQVIAGREREIERLKKVNAALMGDDEDKPRYTTKRVKQEIARATESLEVKLVAANQRAAELEKYAREATKAITSLTIGGSEYFGKRIGEMFTADLPFCIERIRERIGSKMDKMRAEADAKRYRDALEKLVTAKALSGIRALVAGWNGEDKPEDQRYGRHPDGLGVRIETSCGEIYELDEIMRDARAVLGRMVS